MSCMVVYGPLLLFVLLTRAAASGDIASTTIVLQLGMNQGDSKEVTFNGMEWPTVSEVQGKIGANMLAICDFEGVNELPPDASMKEAWWKEKTQRLGGLSFKGHLEISLVYFRTPAGVLVWMSVCERTTVRQALERLSKKGIRFDDKKIPWDLDSSFLRGYRETNKPLQLYQPEQTALKIYCNGDASGQESLLEVPVWGGRPIAGVRGDLIDKYDLRVKQVNLIPVCRADGHGIPPDGIIFTSELEPDSEKSIVSRPRYVQLRCGPDMDPIVLQACRKSSPDELSETVKSLCDLEDTSADVQLRSADHPDAVLTEDGWQAMLSTSPSNPSAVVAVKAGSPSSPPPPPDDTRRERGTGREGPGGTSTLPSQPPSGAYQTAAQTQPEAERAFLVGPSVRAGALWAAALVVVLAVVCAMLLHIYLLNVHPG